MPNLMSVSMHTQPASEKGFAREKSQIHFVGFVHILKPLPLVIVLHESKVIWVEQVVQAQTMNFLFCIQTQTMLVFLFLIMTYEDQGRCTK